MNTPASRLDFAPGRPSLIGMSPDSLAEAVTSCGGKPFAARQLAHWLYARRVADLDAMTDLPRELRANLAARYDTLTSTVVAREESGEGTTKLALRLADGPVIECVLMREHSRGGTGPRDRYTICISTQAGCAMGCRFCATGQAGFTRHLDAAEIVEQVVRAGRRARDDGRRLGNVVFMGMGEPLANYDAVWSAITRIHDELGVSARRITVSTVGIAPGIRRLARERLPVNLAVSLHAADDSTRDDLVPLNRRYPVAEVVAACREYRRATGRRLSFEWALIDGVNDGPTDAARLAAIARPLGAHVNLIPLNPTPGYLATGSPPERVRAFAARLRALGVNATVRANRGTDIGAACGQLAGGLPVASGKPA